MEEHPLYVYGLIEQEDIEFGIEGVNGANRLYTVDSPKVSAVVSDIETVEPEQSEENVRAHNDVLQNVLEHEEGRAVVPMQFGMAFKNRAMLENLLDEAKPEFTRALREVEGMVELGVKIVTTETDDIDGSVIQREASEQFDEIAESTERGDQFSDRLLLNRSYLVDRDDQADFNEAVGEFEAAHEELLVQYTGPWPPYNFVDIQIGAKQ